MVNGFYLLLVLIVAFAAIIAGFRKGITRQTGSLLGLAFGAVASRIFTPVFSDSYEWVDMLTPAPEFNEYAQNLVCSVVIYAVCFLFFSFILRIINRALSVIEIGILNRLLGAFFSLVKNLLWLSIFFNLLICFGKSSRLLYYEKANDGNPVAGVMAIAPAILGCYGGEDFAHFHQLKEAKSISRNEIETKPSLYTYTGHNFNPFFNVILT